jgi:hypothetical protein
MTDRDHLIGLVSRFVDVGRQLPSDDEVCDINTRAAAVANARLLLAEMNTVKRQIDLALGIQDEKEDSKNV